MEKMSIEEIARWLKDPETGRAESIELLEKRTVKELKEIGLCVGVTALGGRKDQIVQQIINHCRWRLVRR